MKKGTIFRWRLFLNLSPIFGFGETKPHFSVLQQISSDEEIQNRHYPVCRF